MFLWLLAEIVEENATDTARLAPVLDHKVFVTPFFKLGVVFGVMAVASGLVGAVKMLGVCLDEIIRRQIRPSNNLR